MSEGTHFWDADVLLTAAAAQLHDPTCITRPYDNCPLDITFLVSCYNEAAYIIDTLDTICAAVIEVGLNYEIVVIDDCSRDKSRELIGDYIARHPDRRILLRANRFNKGLAQNYFDGAFIGKGKYYRLICGDNAEPKESITAVLKAIGDADIIVPYYVASTGKSFKRRLISRAYTALVNLITGNHLHYYNGLAVHLRYNVMRWHSNTRGFGFQADILGLLLDAGFTYKEVPVITVEKREGKSNAITFRNLLSVAHTISEIAIRRVSNRVYSRQ